MDYSNGMSQVATYWPPGELDEYGQPTFEGVDPIVIRCRWQNDQVLYRDNQGREATSNAVVYADREVALRGYLALGDAPSASPKDAPGALEVRQVYTTRSLDGEDQLTKAFL